MMREILICDEAKELLDKNGLSVSTNIDYGYDRRSFFPDEIIYVIAKDGETVFKYNCMGTEKENRKGPEGEFSTEALKACLEGVKDKRYSEQAFSFKRTISKLLELRKEHKFSKFGEKKELKDACEKLCSYRSSGSFSTGTPDIYINVALMEDNRELFEKVLKELEEMESVWRSGKQNKDVAETESTGPVNS